VGITCGVLHGAPGAGLVAQNLGRAKSVMLGVDRSRSMKGKPLREAVAAARAFVAAKPRADRIAVTTEHRLDALDESILPVAMRVGLAGQAFDIGP